MSKSRKIKKILRHFYALFNCIVKLFRLKYCMDNKEDKNKNGNEFYLKLGVMKMHRNCVLIIPSLNPNEELIPYLKALAANGFSKIILVNDGSSTQSCDIFNAAGAMEECDMLIHTVNMGKGRSLKDACNYYCQKYANDYLGVITADADGQHTVGDIIRLDQAVMSYPDSLVLGVRDFDGASVPWKSSFGNKLTRTVMRFLIGNASPADKDTKKKAISDTQTGLRAIPNALVKDYLTLPGERFEYETNMLIEALHSHTPVKEICIQTVYKNGNSETHFRPFLDSIAIYRQIFSTFLKYTLASLSSFLLDYGVYSLLLLLLGFLPLAPKIWIAAALARILSSLYNYAVNQAVVFQGEQHKVREKKKTLGRYYLLCMVQLCCSAQLVWMVCRYVGVSAVAAKLMVDSVLFVVSYYIQKNWVFRVPCGMQRSCVTDCRGFGGV